MSPSMLLHTHYTQAANHVRFRINGDYTDFTLRHVGGDFQVHKIIVCSQSKVFDAACKGGFEVGS